jgi:hypothetical protein
MDPEMVRKLVLRGEQAGALILKVFDEGQWEQHQWVRYLTLMSQVQESLHRAGAPFAEFAPGLSAGLPDVAFYRDGRDAAWCERARLGTTALLTLADGWGPPPLGIDFVGVDPPLPEPVMRVVPKA